MEFNVKPVIVPQRPLFSQGQTLKLAISPTQVSLMRDGNPPAADTPGSLPIRYQQPM